MDQATFHKFREIIYEKSGITLGKGKEALVSARVGKRMRTIGMQDYRKYLRYVMEDTSGEEVIQLLDVISTNVTQFFREAAHFEFLREAFQSWLAKGQRRFRLWCAAASTGEEPYTIAMTLREAAEGRSADIKLLATDISTRVLASCCQGTYRQDKMESVPPLLRDRYFTRHQDDGTIAYTVKPALRNMIVFKRLNLAKPPFPMRGPLDAVFCRNVMIYFDNDIRKNLLAEIRRLLRPGGYLMVGHAESLTGMLSSMKVVRPSVYIRT